MRSTDRPQPNTEPGAAVPAGLVWVSDRDPGIRRLRRGSGFSYRADAGTKVGDAATLRRIKQLAIPPAYRDVWICPRANGHLQATGRDARGRKQYRYHARWQSERGANNFDRLVEFGRVLPRIRSRAARDLRSGSQATLQRVLAALVRLLDTTFVRIGNAAYTRANGSYGLTTLRDRHAGVRGAQVRLSFRGKGGQPQTVKLDDRRVAALLRRCQALPGQQLFQWVDEAGAVHGVGSAEVNDYLCAAAGMRVTAKDFRTWQGSVQALHLASQPGASKTAVLQGVSRALGNTPAVCRKSYVHPRVLALLDSLGGAQAADIAAPAAHGLTQPERRLMRFLR